MPTCQRLTFLVLIVALGCQHLDPYYCPDAPHHNCLAGDGGDGPKGCTNDRDCSAPDAVCDVGATMTCVQCTTSEHDACTGALPVCGSDRTCRGCSAHTECPMSLACLPDGSCGADTNVAYIDPAGTDNNVCSQAMPCIVVAKALATGKPFVKFQGATGTTDEAVVVKAGRHVTFLADPGAKLTRTQGNGAIVTVQDDGTSLSIYDLTITNAPNAPSGIGCVLPAGGGAPTLALTRVKLANNPGGALSATGGTVMISQSMITGNQGGGVSTTGGSTTISRSKIISNSGGGISVTNGAFDITNNFVADNGGDSASGSTFGGLSLTANGSNRLEFNTVAYNHAKMGTLLSAGVACTVTSLVAPNNIITSNNEGQAFLVQTKGDCTFGNSYTAPGAADNTLGFSSITAPLDLHLTASSPPSIVNAAGACTGTDIDGDMRPIGSACDLGADERNP
jgi:parallel beta helix pectate lyase-like protein